MMYFKLQFIQDVFRLKYFRRAVNILNIFIFTFNNVTIQEIRFIIIFESLLTTLSLTRDINWPRSIFKQHENNRRTKGYKRIKKSHFLLKRTLLYGSFIIGLSSNSAAFVIDTMKAFKLKRVSFQTYFLFKMFLILVFFSMSLFKEKSIKTCNVGNSQVHTKNFRNNKFIVTYRLSKGISKQIITVKWTSAYYGVNVP